MMWPRLAPTGLLLLAAVAPALAQDARSALIRSLEQEGGVSYAGRQTTTVTSNGRTRRTVQVVKRRGSGKLRIEYLAPARLKGEVVVDDGERFRRYIPSLKVVEEGPSRLKRSIRRHRDRLQALRQGRATVTLVGRDTLLGRKVTVVSVSRSKSDAPTRTLWLDTETGVPLRVVEKGRSDRTSVTSF